LAIVVYDRQVVLSIGVALIGGLAVPLHRSAG